MKLDESSAQISWIRWARAIAAGWLIVASIAVITDHVTLGHLAHSTQQRASTSDVHVLARRLDGVEHQVSGLQHQPGAVTQTAWTADRQVLESRLAGVEQALNDRAREEELGQLAARVTELDARMDNSRPTPPPAHVTHRAAPAPRPLVPPFELVGRELRGGESFLSVMPTGATRLSQVRVLRPGDTVDDWQLLSLDAHMAVFEVKGQTRTLMLPKEQP